MKHYNENFHSPCEECERKNIPRCILGHPCDNCYELDVALIRYTMSESYLKKKNRIIKKKYFDDKRGE